SGGRSRASRIRPTRATPTPSSSSTTAAADRRVSVLAQVRRNAGHVAPGNLLHAQPVAVQAQRGELAAPDRAGIDRVHVAGDGQAHGGPVPEHDVEVALGMARGLEPRVQAGGLGAGRALLVDGDAPAWGAVAGTGEPVDDRAPAVLAAQAGRPVGLVAVHVAQQAPVAVPAQLALDLVGQLLGDL